MSSTLWVWCSLEAIHRWQIGMLHYSQNRLDIIDECFLHLVVIVRLFNTTTLCSVDSSKICSPQQVEHRCMSQISQNKDVTGVSHI